MNIYTDKIQMEISAVIGTGFIKLQDFTKLRTGSILMLNRSDDCNICLNAGNITIARGVIRSRNKHLEVEVKEKLRVQNA